jgi:hypothetical protein
MIEIMNTWYKNRACNPMTTCRQNRTRIRIRFGALKPKETKNDISPHSYYSSLYMILQTTPHSTHTHASSTIHLLGKCPCGQTSFWANVFLGKCLSGQMSFWANVFWANGLLGKRPSWQTSFLANFLLGKCLLGKCLFGQMSSGQTSYGQMSIWANVFWADVFWANVVLGKCIWANISGQMSYEQMSGHP